MKCAATSDCGYGYIAEGAAESGTQQVCATAYTCVLDCKPLCIQTAKLVTVQIAVRLLHCCEGYPAAVAEAVKAVGVQQNVCKLHKQGRCRPEVTHMLLTGALQRKQCSTRTVLCTAALRQASKTSQFACRPTWQFILCSEDRCKTSAKSQHKSGA